jgi:hypothetical protein
MHYRILLITLISLLVNNVTAAEPAIPQDKAVIQFDTKLGTVTFQHQMHAGLKITECKTCHHKMEPGDTAVKPCHECHQHKAEGEAAKTKDAFHARCIGCHEYTVESGGQAGPVKKKCKLCHIK